MSDRSQQEFTTKEVVGVLQPLYPEWTVKFALLNYYKREGIIVPRGLTTKKGRVSYTFWDMVAVAFFLEMRRHGLNTRHLQDAIECIQNPDLHPDVTPWVLSGKRGWFEWFFNMSALLKKFTGAERISLERALRSNNGKTCWQCEDCCEVCGERLNTNGKHEWCGNEWHHTQKGACE